MPRKRTMLRDLRNDLSLVERFWPKVASASPEQCWPWTACRFWAGYGKFGVDGKTAYAHRVAWVLIHGPIPEDLDVLHTCDNPPCCNPAHLFLGTHADNMRDRERKGRHNAPHGEKSGTSKLNDALVATIRERYRNGETVAALASDVGVVYSTIYVIVTYKRWKHVP